MTRKAIEELKLTVEEVTPKLKIISESESALHHSKGKWSRKQILGHLIDSASNNHQRFVRAQINSGTTLEGYDQNSWTDIQDYQNERWGDLITLWNSYNLHLLHLMAVIPESKLKNTCIIDESEPVSLEFLIQDYLRHLKHHTDQILAVW